ncbi:MAG: uroporphyrinogen-III synthase [Sphingomonadales bacterium]|jgi:uroporphyrinogen-III synthase|nr:uroporphyrinogen-III synthase [Sphingomonadales bacterium]MBK9004698.1 uroporphyrinogen-III synthase [Sphingomonadales bacterium]MBK9269881.1 uroporphyrinogen-III synthase [Sphingomonadales bacterium]MBP6435151.1 uroporphyrinogen-III synthase [Sphingorhabdus sp.]
MKILIIRPQPGNDASAARAREAGFEPVQLPFFAIRPRLWDAPDPAHFDALLVTSANAVRHAGAALSAYRALPLHAVGRNTADIAAAAGLPIASIGEGGVAQAVNAARLARHKRLLWLAGADQTDFVAPPDVQIETRITYSSEPAQLPADVAGIIASADIIALHSARAASSFAEIADSGALSRDQIRIAAFSKTIADAAGTGWRGVAIAERPDDQALLSAARALVKQSAS